MLSIFLTVLQAPLPTVTVSSSNDVTVSAVVPPMSHRSVRHQRESILHYMPPLTSREAQSRPDSRCVLQSRRLFFVVKVYCVERCDQFQVIEQHVDSLLAKLPELNKTCDHFVRQAHDINVG